MSDKYIPIKKSDFTKTYNLPVKYLEAFRNRFGVTLSNVTESGFIDWCEENDIKLVKYNLTYTEVGISDY